MSSKSYRDVKEWRRNNKAKLVEGFGSKCGACGLEDHPIVYDFHHVMGEKDFGIANRISSWNKMVEEAKKCVMLCSHCHRKVHADLIELDSPPQFNEKLVVSQKNNRWGYKEPMVG